MKAKGFAEAQIEETIVQASAAGMLDDRLFAKLWVDSRVMHHPLSRNAVVRELRDKGISGELIDAAMRAGYPAEREPELAIQLARARWDRLHGVETRKRRDRVMAYLVRRGFSVGTARDVVRKLEREGA